MSSSSDQTRVLFMCPHAAGKSLFAATYFRAAAARLGVDAVAAVAGPEPDAGNMANVVEAIEDQGFAVGFHPKLVDASDTEDADILISIGCDVASIPTDKAIEAWDVPMLSDDFDGAMVAIHGRAEQLAASLASR